MRKDPSQRPAHGYKAAEYEDRAKSVQEVHNELAYAPVTCPALGFLFDGFFVGVQHAS